MTISLVFKTLYNNETNINIVERIRCNNCNKLVLITFSKSLLCDRCKTLLSKYAPNISRNINSRILYYNKK